MCLLGRVVGQPPGLAALYDRVSTPTVLHSRPLILHAIGPRVPGGHSFGPPFGNTKGNRLSEDRRLAAVFEVFREIPDLGAMPGDRLVLRPQHPARPYNLIRPLTLGEAQWAFRMGYCRLAFTDPPMLASQAYRLLAEDQPPPQLRDRPDHLRLL